MFDFELRRRCAGSAPKFSSGVGKDQDCGQRVYIRPVTVCVCVRAPRKLRATLHDVAESAVRMC